MFKQYGDASSQPSTFRDIIILALILGAVFGSMLGSRVLAVPDEARYCEIPREMVATGDYITPRLNGVKYFEKPVLFYWLQAASIRVFGLHIWSLHIWTALFALIGSLAVYIAGRQLYGRRAGLLSAGVLGTSLMYYAMSGVITLDTPVSSLITCSLLLFLLGVREPDGRKRRWLFWGFYAFAALATLTKGLIGILIPGMVIFVWMLLLNEWKLLLRMHLLTGLAIFLAIAAPWHVLAARANPEFLRFYFIHEHFERYLTKVHGRYKPFWYFIPILAGGFFPWVAFLVQSVGYSLPRAWKEHHQHRDSLFLLVWAGMVFLFFSASDSKLPPYILPVLPPLAILVGRYLADAWDQSDRPGIRIGYWVLLAASLTLAAALVAVPHFRDMALPLHSARLHLLLLAGIIVATSVAVFFLGRSRGLVRSVHFLMAGTALFFVFAEPIASELDTRPVKDLAMVLKARLQPEDEVMCYLNYYQDLPIYLERRITVVNWRGELDFGSTVEDTSAWIVIGDEFFYRWRGPKTIYMLTSLESYDKVLKLATIQLYPIARNSRNILLSNRESKP